MKKLTIKLLALMLAMVMLLPLAMACDKDKTTEPTEAEKFAAMSDKEKAFYLLNNDVDDSGKESTTMSMDLEFTYMGIKLTATATGKSTTIDTADKYVDYTESVVSVAMMGQSTVMTSKEGWTDGKHFVYSAESGIGAGYYMPQTKEEYIADKEENNDEIPENFGLTTENCTTVTCTQNSYGNWVATFSGVSQDGLTEFKKLIEDFGDMVNLDDLTDISLTLTVNPDFKPMKAEISFVFSGEDAPVISFECNYIIGADVVEPTIDVSGYTETDSLE